MSNNVINMQPLFVCISTVHGYYNGRVTWNDEVSKWFTLTAKLLSPEEREYLDSVIEVAEIKHYSATNKE